MEVNIKGKTYTLRNTIKMYVMFEAVRDRPFNPSLVGDLLILFHSCVVCSGGDSVSYNDVVDLIDRNTSVLHDFTSWLAEESERQRLYIQEREGVKKKN